MNTSSSIKFKLAVSKTSNHAQVYIHAKHMHKNKKKSNILALTVSAERISSLSFRKAAPETIFAANLIRPN